MEIHQTASRPRSRSDVYSRPSSAISQTSQETHEFANGGQYRYGSRGIVTTSVTPTASETTPSLHKPLAPVAAEVDVLKELRSRYKLDLKPTVQQYRLSTEVAGYKLTADLMKPRNKPSYLSYGVRMGEDPLFIKKVSFTPRFSDVRVLSPAMDFGFLHLQVSMGYNWKKNHFGASWRCKTKWTKGSKVQKKVELYNGRNLEVHSFWNVRQQFPQMNGSFTPTSNSFAQDIGRLHLDFHRLKASVHL